jgi:hypothetical protein
MTPRAALIVLPLLLVACAPTTGSAPAPAAADAGALQGDVCASALNARIGEMVAVVTNVAPTASGAVVTLSDGAGPWRCTATADGTVTELVFTG